MLALQGNVSVGSGLVIGLIRKREAFFGAAKNREMYAGLYEPAGAASRLPLEFDTQEGQHAAKKHDPSSQQ